MPERPDKPLTSEQFNIIVAHVKKYHDHLACPFCRTVDQWSVEPIGVIPDFGSGTSDGGQFSPISGRLYVALTCRRCFYTYHFAWLPMKREADTNKNLAENGIVDVVK